MNYLLDVNALIAWAHANAGTHEVFHRWAKRTGYRRLATCAHSELGFLRISMLPKFGFSREDAEKSLAAIKQDVGGFVEIAPTPKLPVWARTAGHTSDAYLVQIAAEAGMTLATFDQGIPLPAERIA